MNAKIVATSERVTLVGGGEISAGDLELALAHAPVLVAADSGADVALTQGHVPQAVIGDFDSLSDATRRRIPPRQLHHIAEQDSTDFDKALRSIDAPLVIAVGFLGARVDHQLAVFNVLVRRAGSPCVLLGAEEVIFAAPRQVALPTQDGDTVSLFPMREATGRSTGLAWPIDGLHMSPWGRVGTSNRATGPVTLDFDGAVEAPFGEPGEPGMLVILPRRRLEGVLTALTCPPPGP
ncbi:Thiamine pyrophosphokinase [Marinibacterium anthonyi]|nr:Thiamine pyrophosphokinase [Marinibacterium anthonyi]